MIGQYFKRFTACYITAFKTMNIEFSSFVQLCDESISPLQTWLLGFPHVFNQNKWQPFIPRIVRFLCFKTASRGSFLWLLSFVSGSAFLTCCFVRCMFTCLVHLTLRCPCLLQTCFLYPFHAFIFFPLLQVLGLPPFGSWKIKSLGSFFVETETSLVKSLITTMLLGQVCRNLVLVDASHWTAALVFVVSGVGLVYSIT